MHDAYEANLMLKLGVQIESMTAYGIILLASKCSLYYKVKVNELKTYL